MRAKKFSKMNREKEKDISNELSTLALCVTKNNGKDQHWPNKMSDIIRYFVVSFSSLFGLDDKNYA